MKKLIAMVLTVALAFAGRADLMTYAPQGGDNLWGNASAWQIDSVAAGRVPTGADDVLIVDSAIDATHPLTVASGTSATVGTFSLSNASATATSPLTLRLAENAVLNVLSGPSYLGARNSKGPASIFLETGSVLNIADEIIIGWNGGGTNLWEISEGASANLKKLTLGRTDNSCTIVTNRGALSATSNLFVGWMNSSSSIFENFGVVTNASSMFVAYSSGGSTYPCFGRYVVHENATHIAKDSFSVGWDGDGEREVRGVVRSDVTSAVLTLGGKACSSTKQTYSTGRLEISGNGQICTNGTFKTRLDVKAGVGKGSKTWLTMRDNAQIQIAPQNSGRNVAFAIGEDSESHLTMSNNAIFKISTNYGTDFACGSNSSAIVELRDSAYYYAPANIELAEGRDASVWLSLDGDSSMRANSKLNIASGVGSKVWVSLADSARLQNSYDIEVAKGSRSFAEIRLKGGVVDKRAYTLHNTIWLGSNDSTAVLRGWGSVDSSSKTFSDSQIVQLQMNGLIVADGAGVARDLEIQRLSCVNVISNGCDHTVNASGTNGWYAINKGRLLFPHYDKVSADTWMIGDGKHLANPVLVNAVKVAFSGAATGSYLHGALYAGDHDDVPEGLPTGNHVAPLAVWRLGYGATKAAVEPGKAVAFTSADVTMKVGLAYSGIKTGRKVRIRPWQYVDGAWVAGEETEFDPENPYVTFTNVEPCVKAGTAGWNLGWFAVTADDSSGLVLLVK